MATDAWKRLLAGASAFRGEGKYFIEAYSEFVPPPRLGPKPSSPLLAQVCTGVTLDP
jgi:hypothetical protein